MPPRLDESFSVMPTAPRNKHARRAAASAGTSFYIARGLPFKTMRQYRENRRDPDSQIAVELARELTRLAANFPRFRLSLNQLQHYVLVQVRSPQWKQHRILDCLPMQGGISMRELVRRSGLDFVSVSNTIKGLHSSGEVISCNRAGRPLLVQTTEHTSKIYWRKK